MSIAFFDSTKVLDALARSGVAEVTVQRGSGGAMNASGTTVMAVPSAKAAVALLQRADRRLAALPSACHEVVTLCVTSQDTQQGEPVHSKLHFVALSRGRYSLSAPPSEVSHLTRSAAAFMEYACAARAGGS